MAIERPTFHEAWYRVADLRPRLLSNVQVYRQDFRGQLWYVLENTVNNQFSRISVEAYRYVALLDGHRTVNDAWKICNEQLGDRAPTQGEVIRLLGILYTANLLYAEIAPDAESLFNRYHKRRRREIKGYLTNLLFIRIPLVDPDHFLNRWVNVVGRLFSWPGLILWLMVLLTGVYFLISNSGDLFRQSLYVLSGDNLVLLYLSFILLKIFHEFSHCFACKKFGQYNGSGGQVHTLGVMFLVFVPVPYMDASSAWAFREKWHRVIVGSAGVIVELFAAAIAAIVWANTSAGVIHSIAYNVIFVASVSTLLFNGNPLLRFDAYYVLSDIIELPNLSQRSKDYLHYLVKRYAWGFERANNPATFLSERLWFTFYGITSTAYRIYIYIRILLFVNDRLPEELFLIVPILVIATVITWAIIPLGKFFHYLFANLELARTRTRAICTTAGAFAILIIGLGLLKMPDYCRIEGIVEPVRMAVVYAQSNGFVTDFLPSGTEVSPDKSILVKAFNPDLRAEQKSLQSQRQALKLKQGQAQSRGSEMARKIFAEQIDALDEKIARIEDQLASLNLKPALAGIWVAPDIDRSMNTYLRRGQDIGYLLDMDQMHIRATAGQEVAALMIEQADKDLDMRMKGRPDITIPGRITEIFPAGQQLLPSESLGYSAGGSMTTQSPDPRDTRAAENFFEIRIIPQSVEGVDLLTGQRIISRVKLRSKPLIFQWWRTLRQLFQRRFQI